MIIKKLKVNRVQSKVKQRGSTRTLNLVSGFTVLESLVAIFILSLSISGVFSAVQQGLSQSIIAKDEIKAYYLAQEAIEIIRNKRDTNQIARVRGSSNSWLAGISTDSVNDPCYFGKVCRVDIVTTAFAYCGVAWNTCSNLNQDQTTYLFNYSAVSGNNLATNFKREVQLESVTADEIIITVRMSWTKGLTTKQFKVKEHLFNWI